MLLALQTPRAYALPFEYPIAPCGLLRMARGLLVPRDPRFRPAGLVDRHARSPLSSPRPRGKIAPVGGPRNLLWPAFEIRQCFAREINLCRRIFCVGYRPYVLNTAKML